MTAFVRLLRRNIEVLPSIAVFFLLVAPYWFSLPVGDGLANMACVRGVADGSFGWNNFLCYAHPTLFFISLFAIPGYLFSDSIFMVHTIMFVLGGVSVFAFHSIVRVLFPQASRLTRMLCVLLYATQPVILANVIDFNFDIGITFFFVMLLAMLFSKRGKWAVLIGTMMVFTKESGLMLYGITLSGFWIFHHQGRWTLDSFIAPMKRRWLFLPFVLYAFHLLLQKVLGNILLHENRSLFDALRIMTSFDLFHERFLGLLGEIFIIQFTWFQTAVMLLALLLWIRSRNAKSIKKNSSSAFLEFLVFVYLVIIYCFTRYVPYFNIRYVMPLYPLSILLFTAGCIVIGGRSKISHVLLVIALFFNGIAMFRSIDPVSAKIFGTFRFGERQLYALGLYDSCCIYGRDGLMYNFEYRKLYSLQERIFAYVHPEKSTIIALPDWADLGPDDSLDPITFYRSWSDNAFLPTYVTLDDILGTEPAPEEFFFIDLPNFNTREPRQRIERFYTIASAETFSEGGYAISVFKYVHKTVPSALSVYERKKAVAEVEKKLVSQVKRMMNAVPSLLQRVCAEHSPDPALLAECIASTKQSIQSRLIESINMRFDRK